MTMPTAANGKVLLRVRPRGFCAGVVRAVDIVELALEAYGAPVYVHHEIVHNTYVVEQLRRRGAIFVETIEEVPHGAVLVFSAHGVPPTVRDEAKSRALKVIDATCPLVTKVHLEALKFAREKRTIILIGHSDHKEIVGTSGEALLPHANGSEPPRHSGNRGPAAPEISRHSGPAQRRHLLRHAESPGSRRASRQGCGPDPRGWLAQQFQFQPLGGSGAAQRRQSAIDRLGEGH